MADNKATNLYPYIVIPTQAVSSGTVTSAVTDIFTKDNPTYQFIWDGTLAGTFDVQTSLDYNYTSGYAGHWDSLSLSSTPAAAGSPSHGTIEINQAGSRYIRVVFTWTSGSGNLSGYVMGKAI